MKIYRCLLILLNAFLFSNNSLGAGYPEVKELWRTRLPKAATTFYVEAVGEDDSWLLNATSFFAWISSSGVLLDSFDKSPMDDIDVVSVSNTDLSYLIDGSIIQKQVNSRGDVSTLNTKIAGVGRSQFGTATPEKRNPFLVFNGNTVICYRIGSGDGSGGETGSGLSQYIKIRNDPVDQYGILGGSVEFKVDVASSIPVTYQWQKDGKDLAGAVLTSLKLDKITAINSGVYTLIVKSTLGSVTSSPAKLDVVSLPIVTFATNSVFGVYGQLTTLAPTIISQGPTFYRWFKDGVLLDTEEKYIDISATGKSGNYSLECKNLAGVVISKSVSFIGVVIQPGAKKWEFLAGGAVSSSPAIGSDGTVYVGSYDNKVYALNGATGAKKWEFLTGEGVNSSPAVGSDGTVYVGSLDNKVYALNGATGAKKWEFLTGKLVMSSPAIGSDGTVYVGSFDNKVYALDGATGAKKWAFITGNWVVTDLAIGSDGTVYVGSDDNKVYALNGATGATKLAIVT
jgi:outer membrane protein assembly factor BamB